MSLCSKPRSRGHGYIHDQQRRHCILGRRNQRVSLVYNKGVCTLILKYFVSQK